MDRAMLAKHLRQAKRHVELGRRHLAQQMAIVAQLERDGHNTTRARELLGTFQSLQECHEADRDRLNKELAGAEVQTKTVQTRD